MPRGIPRDNSINRKIVHRLKISKGHLDKVIKMVEDGDYCIDVVHQMSAITASLKSIEKLTLQNHMRTCVSHSIKEGNAKEYVEEVVKVIEKI